MKNKKQLIILFLCILTFLSFLFQGVYVILTRQKDMDLIDQFVDLPFVIIMAFVSLLIVHTTNKRFKYKDNIYIRVVFELLVTTVFVIAYSFVIQYILRITGTGSETADYWETTILLLLGNTFIVLMLELFFYNQRQTESKEHIAVIEKERAEYLYATLKTQINPHFLFNSLSVLSSLIFEDSRKANIYTKKLSNIYRYVLSTNTVDRILVKDEMTFLESYIYLLSIRFENSLSVSIKGNTDQREYIIPVSLQLLLENAIKHNVASIDAPLKVNIDIKKEYIEVTNNLQPRINVESGGYGLNNLQRQYALYDKKIEIHKTKTQFTIRIPYL